MLMLKFIISIIISAIFLFLSLKGIDAHHLTISLKDANFYWIGLAFLLQFFGIILRGIRWGIQLKANSFKKYWVICECAIAGTMVNLILPARSGDLARVGLAKRYLNYPTSFLGATVFFELMIDTVVAANLSLIYSQSINKLPQWIVSTAECIDIIIVSLLILLIFARKLTILYIWNLLPNKIKFLLDGVLKNIKKGIISLASIKQLIAYSISSFFILLADTLLLLSIMIATGLPTDFLVSFELSVALALSRLAPSTPGYIGIYQFVILAMLKPLGVENSTALTISIYLQLIALISSLLLGLLCLNTLKFKRSIAKSKLKTMMRFT